MKFFAARKEPGNRTIELQFSQKQGNLSSDKIHRDGKRTPPDETT